MARNRFVVPDTQRVPLSDGDWLELKRELTWGEALELNNALGAGFNQKDYNLTNAALWIVDWSFTDDQGKPIAWDDGQDDARSALDVLERRKTLLASVDRQTGIEIVAALEQARETSELGKDGMEAMQVTGTTQTTPEMTDQTSAPPSSESATAGARRSA